MVFFTKNNRKVALNTLLFMAMLALAWADLYVEAAETKAGVKAGAKNAAATDADAATL